MASPATQYDEMRYPGKFYPQSSPERLATLATLYGLRPAPVTNCRVLELGCGDGGNLIPLAYVFPESNFLGIDLASSAVETGCHSVRKLGLRNVELKTQSIMDFRAESGKFDYIIAHGILSWVPESVRQEMLEICARHLAPKGVAYISYNTMPGGYLRNYPRDLMRFHTRHISDPVRKTAEARNIIDFVVGAIPNATIERELLKREMQPYEGKDSFLFHDLLADVNDPIYFLDFMDAAAKCGLQFVAESSLASSRTGHLPESIRHQLENVPDRLLREQYLDFINGRRFRQTVLCRAGHDLNLDVTPDRMEHMFILSSAKPVQPVADLSATEIVEFRTRAGQITCAEPLSKALFLSLGEVYPRTLSFSELRHEICRRMHIEELSLQDTAKLIRVIVSCFVNEAIELHVHRFSYFREISEKPVANPVARLQAEAGHPVLAMNLSGFALPDEFFRHAVTLLDGSRDLPRLVADLNDRLPAQEERRATPEIVVRVLQALASYGVLVA